MDGFVKAFLIMAGIVLLLVSPFLFLSQAHQIGLLTCGCSNGRSMRYIGWVTVWSALSAGIVAAGAILLTFGITSPETVEPMGWGFAP